MKNPWKVRGGTLLSITSMRQKANMSRTSSLPYMEESVTHSWVKGSRLSQRIPENGLRFKVFLGIVPAGRLAADLEVLDVFETPDL